MAMSREALRRPVSGARKLMNFFGGKDEDEQQPQPQPQPAPAQDGQQDPSQIPGREMLDNSGEEDQTRGRFANAEIQGEPKSFFERFAPTILGVAGTAIAGATGGAGAAADFSTNFMATSRQIDKERKAEGQQNLTRFENALNAGRLEQAYSLINTLPSDMMDGALKQLQATDIAGIDEAEGSFLDDVLNSTTSSQLDAILERVDSSSELDGRAKSTIKRAINPRRSEIAKKEAFAEKIRKNELEVNEKNMKLLQEQVDGIKRRNELAEEQLIQSRLETKTAELNNQKRAIELYRDGDTGKAARALGIDLTGVDNVDNQAYRDKLKSTGLFSQEEIDESARQFELARKDVKKRNLLEDHEKSIQNTVRAFTKKIGGFSIDRPLTEADVAEEKKSISEQVAKVKREKVLSDQEARDLEQASLARLQMEIDGYKERFKVNNLPASDAQASGKSVFKQIGETLAPEEEVKATKGIFPRRLGLGFGDV